MKKLVVLLLAAVTLAAGQPTLAQDRGASGRDFFKEPVRDVVRRVDVASDIRSLRSEAGRIDARSGVTRAVYDASPAEHGRSTPDEAARAVLARYRSEFGLERSGELRLVSRRSTDVSHHILFQQYARGLPVYRRVVKVNLDSDLQPTIVLNGIAPGIESAAPSTRPTVSADEARSVARGTLVRGDAETTVPELQLFPSDPPRLAWQMILWPDELPGEWDVLVDAHSGEVVQVLDLASHRIRFHPNAEYRRADLSESSNAVAAATGTGYVFDPDPLTSAGAPYGPPYTDSGDADVDALNDELLLVDLLDISVDNQSNYILEGPHVQIIGGGTLNPPYQPPALASADGFRFTRGEEHFEAVNAYYHVDKSQRYVQSLGFPDRQNGAVKVSPRAFTADNSFYTPSQNIIEFGIGGVDDAEDAGVVWHEHSHALLEAGAPGLNAGGEGQALHEGTADYWAGSYLRYLAETRPGTRSDWENVFRWDSGDGQLWPGRSMTMPGTYPENTTCDDPGDANGDGCRIYTDGLLWATSLMEVYTDVGRPILDRLLLQSHSYLVHPVTFTDAAEALVQADRDLFGGLHTASIVDRLSTRGYLESVGPTISHSRLPASEDLGATVSVEAEVVAVSAAVQSATLYHRVGTTSAFTEQPLTLTSGSLYSADLALPSTPDTVEYYIEAIDENFNHSRLPSSSDTYFRFQVGPDSESPEIVHTPIALASAALWPAEVAATVTDNLGVDTVWVQFTVRDGAGIEYDSGTFGLTRSGTDYRGFFTTAASALQTGSTVRYSISARDAAAAGNSAVDPASGQHEFPIVFSGLLQQWDLEITDGNFGTGGVWEHGPPTFTLRAAHSGDRVWGTNLGGSYPDAEGSAYLELPEINLDGLSTAYLIFWHWYDFEYRGQAEPGQLVQGTYWDGGNVKVASNGSNYQVVEPLGGYPGAIDAGTSNPLGGENAFGAYSFGWRREVIPLPVRRGVKVRFELGYDDSNVEQSVAYAGWFIDDIAISTDRPVDSTPPSVVSGPPSLTVQPVGQPLPNFSLEASDDTGVASVYVDYSHDGDGATTGSFPLAMSFSDLSSFVGFIPSDPSLGAGDRFEYRYRVTDFDGNETIFPPSQENPHAVEYRTVRTVDVLVEVVPTGAWAQSGSRWVTQSAGETQAVSSLVLPPTTLPSNAADIWLGLQHSYKLGDGLGGNVSMSTDDGRTWAVIDPVDGYPARFAATSHPMNGRDVFAGETQTIVTSLFDVSSYGGREVRFRFDFGADREPDADESWSISSAAVQASSTDPEVEFPIQLTLNANFPDPFSGVTNISYSVPEQGVVRIDVYNALGQLVALVTNRVHAAGTHTTTFDGSRLPSGVYFLILDTEEGRKVERMVVAR